MSTSTTKKAKVRDINVSVRRVDNGYVVHSYAYKDVVEDFINSEKHCKESVYSSKEEAIKFASSLINAFSSDLR